MFFQPVTIIASYEAKFTNRSWIFRVFSVFSLVGIALFQLFWQSYIGSQYAWDTVAMASYIPFLNSYVYDLLQSLLVTFAISDVFRREKLLASDSALKVRPVSNMTYWTGKMIGVGLVFIVLNLCFFCIALFINLFLSDSPFNFLIYIYYFFTLNLPTLIFMIGFISFLNTFFKHAGISLFVALSILGGCYFWMTDVSRGILDVWARSIPNIFSEITGHPDFYTYLLYRVSFLFFGTGLFFLSVFMQKRLTETREKRKGLMMFFLCFFCCLFSVWGYQNERVNYKNTREIYRVTYMKYRNHQPVRIKSHDIVIDLKKDFYISTSRLTIKNEGSDRISQVLLYLNPGLQVTSIEHLGQTVGYTRDKQAILLDCFLLPGEQTELLLKYEGKIDDRVCYLDIPSRELEDLPASIFSIPLEEYSGRRFSFLTSSFVFLSPECLWYPVGVPPVDVFTPYLSRQDFTRYRLEVHGRNKGSVVSQGEAIRKKGAVTFTSSVALPGLTLLCGDYSMKRIQVDSVLLEFCCFKEHDFLVQGFTLSSEYLQNILSESLKNYGQFYAYDRLRLVEVPLPVRFYNRMWKQGDESIQPEMVLFPERLSNRFGSLEAWKKSEKKFDPKEKESVIEERYINEWRTFLQEPLYYWYLNHMISKEFVGINFIFNLVSQGVFDDKYKKSSFNRLVFARDSLVQVYLENHSLEEALLDTTLSLDTRNKIILAKGEELQAILSIELSGKDWVQFLKDYYRVNRFSIIDFEQMSSDFEGKFGIDLSGVIREWYQRKRGLPLLLVKDIQRERIQVGEYEKYIVSFKVYNPSKTDGIVSVLMRTRGSDVMFSHLSYYRIGAGCCQKIRIRENQYPTEVRVGTLLSKNIPSDYQGDLGYSKRETTDTTTGIFPIDTSLFSRASNEIVVDNEDPGFTLVGNRADEKSFIFGKERIKEDPFTRANNWKLQVQDKGYGYEKRRVWQKMAGKGNFKAIWTTDIPEAGRYELFVYLIDYEEINTRPRIQAKTRLKGSKLHYAVSYKEEEVPVVIEPALVPEGWMSLGVFDLPAGKSSVILDDRGIFEDTEMSKYVKYGQLIMADAVKWVYLKDE